MCEQILRGQQPGLVERLSIPRSLQKQPLQLQISPSLTSPSSPAFRILCAFSLGWLSRWVMRHTSRKLKQAWSGLATSVSSSKFHYLEKSDLSKKKKNFSPEQLWISCPEMLMVRLTPKCFKVIFILTISSLKMQHLSGLCCGGSQMSLSLQSLPISKPVNLCFISLCWFCSQKWQQRWTGRGQTSCKQWSQAHVYPALFQNNFQ